MENEGQEAQNISSALNVPLVDVQAPESGATDLHTDKNGCVKEEGCTMSPSTPGETTENGYSQEDALPVQPPLHHHNESASTQAILEQEESSEVKNAADNASMEMKGSMRSEAAEGETQAQVEQEPVAGSNEGECFADVASMDSIENVENLADSNGPVQIEQEPEWVSGEVECAASGASMIPMQQEEELVQDETLPQMEQQVGTSDNGGTEEKESYSDSPNHIEEYSAVGSNEGENAGTDASINTMQKEDGLILGKASIQVGEELEVGINEGACAADDISLDIAPIQIERKHEAGSTEGECTGDDTPMVISHEEEALGKGEAHVQISQEDYAGLDEGEGAADDIGESEEATDSIVEVSVDACGMVDVEGHIETEQSASDSANQDASSCSAIEFQEDSQEDNSGRAVFEEEPELRNQDTHACEAVEEDVDAKKQDVQADPTEFPAVEEHNEKADHQSPSAAGVDEPPAVPTSTESGLMMESPLCTSEIGLLSDQRSDGDEVHEGKGGNDGQSDATNASIGGQEMEKVLSRELPDFSKQDAEIKQPTAQGLPYANEGFHMKPSLAAEGEPVEDSLATDKIADEKQLEALKKEELGLDTLVTEQTSKGEGDVAATPMLVEENGDVYCSAVGEGAMNKLERIADTQLNGKVASFLEVKAANGLPPTMVEHGFCRNIGEDELEANASKINSSQNGLFLEDATADGEKHMASEQFNGFGKIGTHLEKGTNAAKCQERVGVSQAAEAPMDAAVPLSSMVHENGFVHHSEDNILGHQCTTSISVQPTQDEKSREISQFLVVPQQKAKDSEGSKQNKVERPNGNMALVLRSSWWGCCGMLDALLHKD
ncbi:hypothetical protein GOP47_0019268 [Adiantum capillus-veneris]|uniref:Uncharacterized protein n=1 Tax=Adiantum capillus-veneris TaxID=13818 RepID=A0A9D4UFY2_ADICA|nr:hypothetical protein GOP47_0019268 [Adiantum capillus-veneris]